jgi:2,3,4,5-tetrahydropyridine-2-carboxylate N-succinyltransferase
VAPSREGYIQEPEVVQARQLAGMNDILFRRNSQSGAVEALPRPGVRGTQLNSVLHNN